jgi:hypothetical protein
MTGSTRRDWLRFCAAAGASGFFVSPLRSAEHSTPALAAVDHLLLGVSDLDRGIAWVEKATGVRAAVGGSHPGGGTRNALLSLGGRRYLEIIAPDPAQTAFNFRLDLRKLSEPRLITWAAATRDIDAISRKARGAGLSVLGPEPGSRQRPDGKVLRWKTLRIKVELEANGVDPIPFFIEWAPDSLHPSQDSPKGCDLLAFEVAHPQRAEVRRVLEKLGIDASVKLEQPARLRASLKTPGGAARLA